ncbi:Conserved hypothetical protein [Yarrowia lipolytica]|nr:Conserved hypothetical protein [Yarrowia lipolytica]
MTNAMNAETMIASSAPIHAPGASKTMPVDIPKKGVISVGPILTPKNSSNMPNSTTPRRCTFTNFDRIVECLSLCFSGDPVDAYYTQCDGQTEEESHKLDIEIFSYATYVYLLKGRIYTIGDFEGISCWLPPGEEADDWWTALRSGGWTLPYKFGKEGRIRYFKEYLPKIDEARERHLKPEDAYNVWYLGYLGTLPSARGKGLSRKLVEHVTNIADKQGLYCYLESTKLTNQVIYERFGFDLRETFYLTRAETPVPVQFMIRAPKPNPVKNRRLLEAMMTPPHSPEPECQLMLM